MIAAMLRYLKRLAWWWSHYGEGAFVSRTVTLVGSFLTICAFYLHLIASKKPAHIAELEDRVGLIMAWAFGGVTLLLALLSFMHLKVWPWRKAHPAGPLAARYILDPPPEPGWDSPYRFHRADSLAELGPYVTESEYFLGDSNPELDRKARLALYQDWLGLSRDSFLYLRRMDRQNPVALSIILPLTKKGYESLYGISRPQKKVVDFRGEEIAKRGPYQHLLVDTFIVSKRQERLKESTAPGKQGYGYGRTLLLRHLALFWKDANSPNPRPVVIIAETDKQRLVTDLLAIGFQEKGTSAIKCPLFEFEYPLRNADVTQTDFAKAAVARISAVGTWRIR